MINKTNSIRTAAAPALLTLTSLLTGCSERPAPDQRELAGLQDVSMNHLYDVKQPEYTTNPFSKEEIQVAKNLDDIIKDTKMMLNSLLYGARLDVPEYKKCEACADKALEILSIQLQERINQGDYPKLSFLRDLNDAACMFKLSLQTNDSEEIKERYEKLALLLDSAESELELKTTIEDKLSGKLNWYVGGLIRNEELREFEIDITVMRSYF